MIAVGLVSGKFDFRQIRTQLFDEPHARHRKKRNLAKYRMILKNSDAPDKKRQCGFLSNHTAFMNCKKAVR
jgi:hypothetical protein